MKKHIYGFIMLTLGAQQLYAVNHYRLFLLPIAPHDMAILFLTNPDLNKIYPHVTLPITPTINNNVDELRDSNQSMSEEEQS